MAEYIERDAVFKIVADMMCDCKVRHKGRAINRNIKQLPTADVVSVVRCKDCKHYKTDSYYCQKTKQGYCELDDTVKQKQGYCSYGERRWYIGCQRISATDKQGR